MALTLVAAINKPLQGMLLTIEGFGFFIGAMLLIPKIRAASANFLAVGRSLPSTGGSPRSSAAVDVPEHKEDSTSG